MDALAAVRSALAHVMERPEGQFPPAGRLRDLGIDSIALVVTADVLEQEHPGWLLPDSALRDSVTVQDLADGVVPR